MVDFGVGAAPLLVVCMYREGDRSRGYQGGPQGPAPWPNPFHQDPRPPCPPMPRAPQAGGHRLSTRVLVNTSIPQLSYFPQAIVVIIISGYTIDSGIIVLLDISTYYYISLDTAWHRIGILLLFLLKQQKEKLIKTYINFFIWLKVQSSTWVETLYPPNYNIQMSH